MTTAAPEQIAQRVLAEAEPVDHVRKLSIDAALAVLEDGLRHKMAQGPRDYLRKFLKVGRAFAYATHDGSWGEFEKEFEIILRRMTRAEADSLTLAREVLRLSALTKAPSDATVQEIE